MSAEPLKDVVKTIVKKWNDEASKLSQEQILKIWRDAAGEKLAGHSSPMSFRAQRLVVNVDSSSYLYELTLRRAGILKRLKRKFKRKPIKELQFRIGEV